MARFQGIPIQEQSAGGRFGGVPVQKPVAESVEPERRLDPVNSLVGMAARGLTAFQGMQKGARDIVDGGAGLLVNALPEGVVRGVQSVMGERFAPNAAQFNKTQENDERAYQASRAARGESGFDGPRLAGNVVGTAPVMAIAPGAGPTLMGTALRGAATGGGMGALQPVVNTERPYWDQKGEQVAVGAATGGLLSPGIQAAGRAASPQIDKGVKYLMDRGVRVRPDQIIGPRAAAMADKAQSLPIVGDAIAGSQRRAVEDFNVGAYNEVLKPMGVKFSGAAGRDGVASVQKTIGDAYDKLLPNLQFTADPRFVSEFKKVAQMAQSLPPDKKVQFDNIVKNEIIPRFSRTGQMDGLTFKQMEGELGKFATRYGSSPSPDDRALADAVREIVASSRNTLERSNPQFAGQLRKLNQSWASFTRVQDAASRIGTEEGVFTPAQLLSAVRAGDKSARKGSFARGDAMLQRYAETGKKVIGNKYPDSGTAGRLANMGAGAALFAAPGMTTLGAAAGAAPYTEFGQKLATALLTKRPSWAEPIRPMLERAAVPVGSFAGFGLVPQTP